MLLCSPHGGRSKRKGKGIWARDRARRRRGREFRHETVRMVSMNEGDNKFLWAPFSLLHSRF